MSLYLTYHPWVPGTMSRDRVLAMLSENPAVKVVKVVNFSS